MSERVRRCRQRRGNPNHWSDEVLIRVLHRRGYRLEDGDECDEDGFLVDGAGIASAGHCFRRGDVAEALFLLERALPDSFAGLSAAAVPALPLPLKGLA